MREGGWGHLGDDEHMGSGVIYYEDNVQAQYSMCLYKARQVKWVSHGQT